MKQPFAGRLAALRTEMRKHGIDAYLILTPEYSGAYFTARSYVSGFTGSAGTLAVTADDACLWTDGRYFIQARDQLEGTGIRLMKSGEPGVPTIPAYLKSVMRRGQSIAYDGRTVPAGFAASLRNALAGTVTRWEERLDLVDPIWPGRPAFPAAPIWEVPLSSVGKARSEKLRDLRTTMEKAGADAHLIAALDDLAWLFNYRGNDIEFNPVAMAYALIYPDRAVLYIAPEAVPADFRTALEADGVELRPYGQVFSDAASLKAGTKLLLDRETVDVALLSCIPAEAELVQAPNPVMLAKAIKNTTEQENLRRAHILDGIALTKVIYRLKQIAQEENFTDGRYTEMTVAGMLQTYREPLEGFLGQSFNPIVATGTHGAIVHYDPRNAEAPVPLENNTFLLIDTGGHYMTGTTDITRTVSFGQLTDEMRLHYTTVLRGTLSLAAVRFPHGCTGANLDVLARQPLWALDLDYKHGTGHGVGFLLNVHEDPNHFRLHDRAGGLGAVQEPGMVTSDEPGVYLEGKYGVRLENLLLCQSGSANEYGQFLYFEPLTVVPFDRAAIDPAILSDRELGLLNDYHAKVYETVSPYLTDAEREWLAAETAPITK